MTNDKLEAARTGNWFHENPLVIARLDKSARDEAVQAQLAAPECRWDLVVVDEAHKMSATFFGGEVKYTKRYRLGQLLSGLTRHFLLLTATPHNGKEEDFQLFLALLDGDRFEGRFRDGVHVVDVSDLMRRMLKERLVKFDGTPLFPERVAYTVPYRLSDAEARLYKDVTEYVREEFNRADAPRHRRPSPSPSGAAGSAWRVGCVNWNCSSAGPRFRPRPAWPPHWTRKRWRTSRTHRKPRWPRPKRRSSIRPPRRAPSKNSGPRSAPSDGWRGSPRRCGAVVRTGSGASWPPS